MKRYPHYKDSGVAWLGEVPQHWKVKQCRHIFKIHNGATPKSGEADYWSDDIVWITPEDLGNNEGKEISDSRRKISKEGDANCGTSLAPAGSIALSNRAPIGHLAKTTVAACVNQGCRLLEVLNDDADFLYYQLYAAKSELISLGQGTTFMELTRQNLAALKLVMPPISEQQAIAAWLDAKTAQIDALIRRKQVLLEKLAEKRSALISHAVTKGLNPAAAMKDSGVAWLGEVPQHWEVSKLRWHIKISSGDSIHHQYISQSKDDVNIFPVIGGNGVMGYTELVNSHCALVVGRVGALCGNVHIVDCSSWITDNALKISYWSGLEIKYFFYVLVAADLNNLANKTAQPLITGEMVKSLLVCIPPLPEQQAIAAFLDSETARIDTQRQAVEKALAKLQEYRSALISHAVTGKIDIRHL